MANTLIPPSIQLKAENKQKFQVSVTWSIEPAGDGGIDSVGNYTAPDSIENKREVKAVAKGADGKEIGSATITLLPEMDNPPAQTDSGVKAVIQPSVAWLKKGGKIQFKLPCVWAIDPADAPGKIEPTGEYIAPSKVEVSSSFAVVARNVRADELGRSTVTLVPSPPPIRSLTVIPEKAELKAGQQMAFRAEPGEQAVIWRAGLGKVEDTGVYTAPNKIVSQQTVILTAKSIDGAKYGNATLTLSNTAYWTHVLAIYWLLVSVLLTVIIGYLWPSLSTPSQSLSVIVTPPIVTMATQSKQQFTAEVLGGGDDLKKAVTWKASDGRDVKSGVYSSSADTSAPALPTQITASIKEDPTRSGIAKIYLTKDQSLAVLPASVRLQASQTAEFTLVANPAVTPSDIKWSLSRNDLGEFDSNGNYTAPPFIDSTQIVTVHATNGKQNLQAAANIILLGPQPRPNESNLIFFVILMGMLGSVLHAVMSFTVYVGAGAFMPSWSWWYIFRPVMGGGIALFFFFLVGLGKVSEATTDPKWLGLICGLVGLFSDTAIRKLGEIFNVILGTKEDKRGDKLPDEEAKTPTKVLTGKGPPPVIRELNPNPVTKKETPMLIITGANFRENATVRVNSIARKPEEVTSTSIRVQLTADDMASGDAKIIVINEDLTESNVETLTVR